MTMHNGHEFEDRDSQLPADTRAVGAGVRPGTLDRVPLGTPEMDFDVRSTYSVRPVNGFDFTFAASADSVSVGESEAIWTFTFTVPTGYVAVVRWYEWFSDGGGLGIASYRASLLRNGVNFPYNSGVYIGPQGKHDRLYMLVDEEQTFGVRVEGISLDSQGTGYLNIGGNLILKTGRAYPYEIANPVGVIRQSVLAPEPLRMPPPPPREAPRVAPPPPPPPSQPQPAAAPTPVGPPPFDLAWIKQTNFAVARLTPAVRARTFAATNAMAWVPAVATNRGRDNRPLTDAEATTYADYIDSHRPTIGNYR